MRAPVVLHLLLVLAISRLNAVDSHPVSNGDGKSHRLSPASAGAEPKRGSSFDQERLVALFGSEAQPVYGNRDPSTGKIVFDSAPMAGSRASAKPVPFARRPEKTTPDVEEPAPEEADAIDRKDTRVPETNEVNPFEMLPPQFHDLLNIPIHDYGNGTTFNPYDKFKTPVQKHKIPLVSSGYANTKVQGTPAKPPKYRPQQQQHEDDYDYETDYVKPTKATRKPKPSAPVTRFTTTTTARTTTTTTTTTTDSPDYYDDNDDKWTTSPKRARPTSQPTYDHYDRPSVTKRPASVTTKQTPAPNNKFYSSRPEPVNREPVNRPGSYGTEPYRAPSERRPVAPLDEDDFRPVQKPVTRPPPTDEARPVYKGEKEIEPETLFGTDDDEDDSPPIYVPRPYKGAIRPEYQDGEQVAEFKVTPKPFFAADETSFNKQVAEHDDIIYDYDDERNQGQGVLFMFDKEPSVSSQDKGAASTVAPRPPVTTPSPVASTYPTVAIRDKPQAASPAFRPSAPITPIRADPVESGFPSFGPAQFQQPQRLPSDLNAPPFRQQQQSFAPAGHQPGKHQLPPPPQSGFVAPRPPFRPEQAKEKQQQQPPNILPLFRPNTQPNNEFQFIKHPHQITDFQRPSNPQIRNEEFRPRPPPSSGMGPLPSALQTPFSSISQAVANFFGRRSGSSFSSRSGNLDATLKMDRSGMNEEDLMMDESQASPVLAAPSEDDEQVEDQIAIESSPDVAQQVVAAPDAVLANPPPLGFKVSPDDASPPAFYIYTEKELEEGKPPYLVVGPVMSGPPKVDGAKLVHTAPVQSLPLPAEGAQRRSDVPTDFRGAGRPFNPNALPVQAAVPPAPLPPIPQGERFASPQAAPPPRKPFFPISGPGGPIIKLSNRPPQSGLKPPPPSSVGTQGFVFPQNVPEELDVIPQGIAPVSPGVPPPRVPLNPQKDIASTFSNPTLLHNRPIEAPTPALSALQLLSRPLNSAPERPPVSGQGFANQQPLAGPTVTSTPKPPVKRKRPTKGPVAATTTPALPAFNPQQTVTYSTIQQEDGKKIAVVHPAYIVTYKYEPGPPELVDLDAPFVPSVESSPQQTEIVPLEKWQAVPTTTEQASEAAPPPSKLVDKTEKKPSSPTKQGFNLESGFVPFVPDEK